MLDLDDAEVGAVVSDALDQLVVDLGVAPTDAAGALVLGGLAELSDLGDTRAVLVIYRQALECLMAELGRLEAAAHVRH